MSSPSAVEVRPPAAGWVRGSVESIVRALVVALSAVPGVLVPFLGAVFVGASVDRLLWYGSAGPLLALVFAFGAAAVLAGVFVRPTARWTRSQTERWYGGSLQVEYTPRPALERDERGYWWTGYSYHRGHGTARLGQLLHWSFRDPATRGEMLWLLLNPAAALALVGPVVGLLLGGGVLGLMGLVDSGSFGPYEGGAAHLIPPVLGALLIVVGAAIAPHAVRAHSELARRILDPLGHASHAQLTRRVAELTVTRADAVGNQAAELRRIERDLHDGAQARLVAIGMTLGTIEHLMDADPAAARELLSDARQSSAKALQELRDLVRGIHPPVLAERGLGDAVKALALDSVLPTEVTVSLPDRPEASMEAAVYFCVSELLANAAKHSRAQQVWVDILFRAGQLRVTVTDDGHGGAAPERGSGLRGIERRLGTFDGVLSLSSPQGGPTTITMELPCALSSPRISTSSEKG